MDLLEKLKCKNLTFTLGQFVKFEKLEETALKFEFAKIMINLKACFFSNPDFKGGFPMISKSKKFLQNVKCFLNAF